jgi:peptide alpha-N-acetyltransferase
LYVGLKVSIDYIILIYLSHMLFITPLILTLLFQGKILQHAGNFTAAAALADEARSMDLADRYLNSECVMQMLQADQVAN